MRLYDTTLADDEGRRLSLSMDHPELARLLRTLDRAEAAGLDEDAVAQSLRTAVLDLAVQRVFERAAQGATQGATQGAAQRAAGFSPRGPADVVNPTPAAAPAPSPDALPLVMLGQGDYVRPDPARVDALQRRAAELNNCMAI